MRYVYARTSVNLQLHVQTCSTHTHIRTFVYGRAHLIRVWAKLITGTYEL
jgi:hypothetical protein